MFDINSKYDSSLLATLHFEIAGLVAELVKDEGCRYYKLFHFLEDVRVEGMARYSTEHLTKIFKEIEENPDEFHALFHLFQVCGISKAIERQLAEYDKLENRKNER